MDKALLDDALAGEPAFRARQVWEWAARGAAGYDEMMNVPAPLRTRLAESVPFSALTLEHEAHSKDATLKALFRTHDGHLVEAVLMRYRDGRRSVCVSSQSGCPLTCTFCATGQMRFGRNLTAWEVLDQALHFRRLDTVDATSGSWGAAEGVGPEGTVHVARARRARGTQRRQAAPEAGSAGRDGVPARGLTHCVFMGMG